MGEEFYIVAKGCVAVVVTIEKSENANHRYTVNTDNDNNKENKEFIVGGRHLSMLDPGTFTQFYNTHPRTNNKIQNTTEELKSGGNLIESNDQKEKLIAPNNNDNKTTETSTTIKERIVYEFKSGDYFGEVSLVIKIPRTATIKATENTTLLELTNSDFQKFIPHQNQIKQNLERVAHERIAQSFRRYKIPLFNAVPLDQYHILSQLSQIKYFKAGEVICDPDSEERALYVVAHGNVGVYVTKQRIGNTEETEDEKTEHHLDHSSHAVPTTSMINIPTSSGLRCEDIIVPQNTISHFGDLEVTRHNSEFIAPDRMTLSAEPHPITPMQSHSKKVSQHLLSANFNLLTTMIQREAVNRELIRLSFLSEQASKRADEKNQSTLPLVKMHSSNSEKEQSESPSAPSPIPYTPSQTVETIKLIKPSLYPITPPPSSEHVLNKRKETNESTKTLNIRVADFNEDDLGSIKSAKRETSHGRFHTALGTPSSHDGKDRESDLLNIEKRRNSENVLVKFKIHKPLGSPLSDRSQLFGYERKQKLVRIADLMLPDEKMDKLRAISRRGSLRSNFGGDPYASPMPFSTPISRNRTLSTQSTHVQFSPKITIDENIKIDPMDPAAFEN